MEAALAALILETIDDPDVSLGGVTATEVMVIRPGDGDPNAAGATSSAEVALSDWVDGTRSARDDGATAYARLEAALYA